MVGSLGLMPHLDNPHWSLKRRMCMHFLASFDCICSQFRSRDLHHVFIPVPMCALKDGFLRFFPTCVDFHSLKPSHWLLHLGLTCWLLFFYRFLHLPLVQCFSCNCKMHMFHGFITIYQGSSPNMLYGEVLNNMGRGSVAEIFHWKTLYLSPSGVVLRQ